jgi:tRNA nucleotidyltransferase (CCA-adding enzyme)
MASNSEEILADISKKITPSQEERKKVLSLADTLVERVNRAAREAKIEAKVRVEGSVAKDTWLRGEPEIDIFLRLPTSTPREALGTVCLDIARKATKGARQVERFAEHPYLEAFVNKTRVNIVPCYQTKPTEWLSATDRTPYHTDFVKPRLNDKLRGETRLLKRFMKGIGVYGAEIKIGGFSGYLCELLTLKYETFTDTLKAAANWRKPWIIDYLHHYKGREDEIPKIFEEPLIVIDPVDKGRNVASAVRPERLIEITAASQQFLRQPTQWFFFPRISKVLSQKNLVKNMKSRGTSIIFIKTGSLKTVSDILWGQLYKTERSLRKMLSQNDFCILNEAVWSDEKVLNLLLFEAEHRSLPRTKKHIGPPVEKGLESERFLRKHLGSSTTISGPRLEEGRWVVDIKRKHTDIVELLKESLKTGGRQVGVAYLISKELESSLKILVNEEIMPIYLSNHDFAAFLTEYLKGKPTWLD